MIYDNITDYSIEKTKLLKQNTKNSLAEEVLRLQAQLSAANEGNDNLYNYCASSKFQGTEIQDKMINKDDIFLRLSEIQNSVSSAQYQYGLFEDIC